MSKIKKELDAKIKMFKAIITLYFTYKVRFDVIPAFAAAITIFKDRYEAIELLVPLASEDTKAMTEQRDALRTPLYVSTVVVAKAVWSYAESIDDLLLKGAMNWTVGKLERLPLDQLGPNCDAIYKKAKLLLVEAGPFGLDEAKLDKLKADHAAWAALESGTRNKQVEISGNKRLLSKRIGENMKLLTGRMDGMVLTLLESDPDLVGLWNQAQAIVSPPKIETQVKVVVKEKMTGTFIYEAEVQLMGKLVYKAITNVSGEAEFKPVKAGLYLFKVAAPGYKPYQVIQQRVLKGKITRLEVELERELVSSE